MQDPTPPDQATVAAGGWVTITGPAPEGGGWRAISSDGLHTTVDDRALDPRIRLLRPGQRLRVEIAAGGVRRAWLG